MYSVIRATCYAEPTGLLMGYGPRPDWRLVGHCVTKRGSQLMGKGSKIIHRTSYGCFPFFLL
jgi:hypothetical protein